MNVWLVLRFMYVSVNCVGSTHDSMAFQNSALHNAIMAGGGQGNIPGGFYLIGDEAYVASDWMVVPYSGQRLPVDMDPANYYISLARQVIERSFGVLVSRFGILHRPITCGTKRVPKLLGALVRLHNLCLKEAAPIHREFMEGDTPTVYQQDDCAEVQPGRRRDAEVSAPRDGIRTWLAERGMIRPSHSHWGRSNSP